MQWKLVFTNFWFSLIKWQELKAVWAALWEAAQAQPQGWELHGAVAGHGFHFHSSPLPTAAPITSTSMLVLGPGAVRNSEFLGFSSLLLWAIFLFRRWSLAYLHCRFCNASCLRKINVFGSLLQAVYAGNILIKHWGKSKIRLLIS